jgi:hypothetical protein
MDNVVVFTQPRIIGEDEMTVKENSSEKRCWIKLQ